MSRKLSVAEEFERKEKRRAYKRDWNLENPERRGTSGRSGHKRYVPVFKIHQARKSRGKGWVGIDGEGVTVGDPWYYDNTEACVVTGERHLYVSMSWQDQNGRGNTIYNAKGLSTTDCLEFILGIPKGVKIMAYGFGYDLTKILEELSPELLFRLCHPILREIEGVNGKTYEPIEWNGYLLDLFNSRFKVGRIVETPTGLKKTGWRVVHDISKFYQCKFVTACERWKIGSEEERKTMTAMKDDRRNLGIYTPKQQTDYSEKECQWGAELAQRLDDAHTKIKIDLRGQYYGAGSTAKALMREWHVEKKIPVLPEHIEAAAACAFFGGRFEIALRGPVQRLVYDRDISAAYPYQISFLPCLKCGTWSETRDIERVKEAQAALVHYELKAWTKGTPAWGPFPFRDNDGSIPFPIESGGGWIHKDEFLAGKKLFPNVRMVKAYVYETFCDHRIFRKLPEVYLERLRIGKEAAGIVLKLGTNAIAGSIMQTVGKRRYYCPVWAGMITSGTRAQLLEMLAEHENLSDVIMMATDGIWSLVKTGLPKPKETATDIEVIEDGSGKKIRKPLGGWEEEEFPDGVFMARPGIYFPLGIKDEKGMKDLKARGIGVKTLYEHRVRLMHHYDITKGEVPYVISDLDPIQVVKDKVKPEGIERFVGLKGGLLTKAVKDPDTGEVTGLEYRKRASYGLWTLQRRVVGFNSRPKRDEGDGYRLTVRRLSRKQLSLPYDKGKFEHEDLYHILSAQGYDFGGHDDDQADYEE